MKASKNIVSFQQVNDVYEIWKNDNDDGYTAFRVMYVGLVEEDGQCHVEFLENVDNMHDGIFMESIGSRTKEFKGFYHLGDISEEDLKKITFYKSKLSE